MLLGHKTGDIITSHYSAPELAELVRAASAVLKAQESTLLRVVPKRLQVVSSQEVQSVCQLGIVSGSATSLSGTTIAELQELGAWKSELMVKRYAHFAPE